MAWPFAGAGGIEALTLSRNVTQTNTTSFGGNASEFRLTGLAGQGSTPWMVAGFVALLFIGFGRDIGSFLLDVTSQEKEVLMNTAKKTFTFLVFGMLNLTWAIGASAMAVPLLA